MQHTSAQARFQALAETRTRTCRTLEALDGRRPPFHLSDCFGINTFNGAAMRQKLSSETFQALQRTIRRGEKLKRSIAGEVAHAMKEWALEKGASSFCHWFQPQNGLTAEKHDSFLSFERDGSPIERFSAGQLIQSEPDASSFPSGGMRSTFEARGYTAWDPSSPVFIMDGPNGKTLCIPSIFISYHGQALDKKTPLLRSMEYLSQQARGLISLLGKKDVERVIPTLGVEQEYFLVDSALYQLRPDLYTCGRTLLGAPSTKGQQLEDHYFGSIKPRVLAFIQEAEFELYKLGVPIKTRHNEVAPHQFEAAPMFEEANIASDHNQLLMEIFKNVAERHKLTLLLHEKPFAGVNGSGKHCNWSLMDDEGNNLLAPGESPAEHLQFLCFLAAVLQGVHRRAGLLRASVATSGNDHRLGANEAPPAILSVFLGEELSRLLDLIAAGEASSEPGRERILRLGLAKLPDVEWDTTDRNRTSPFAFTGSKFEFRAVPSSAVGATPVTYLNAAVGEALAELSAQLRNRLDAGSPLEQAVLEVVREAILASRPIRFDGNNYDPGWVAEAARRSLPNLANAPAALEELRTPGARELFVRAGVYSEEELLARYHVKVERYVKELLLEAACLRELATTAVLPAALAGQQLLGEAIVAARTAGLSGSAGIERQQVVLQRLADGIGELLAAAAELSRLEQQTGEQERLADRATFVAQRLVPALGHLRTAADELELQVPDCLWPLPKYRELLLLL